MGRSQRHGNARLVWFPAFSRNVPPFVTGISRTVKIAGIGMLVRFFAQRHKLPCLIHQVLGARTVVDRLKPLEASGYLPVL